TVSLTTRSSLSPLPSRPYPYTLSLHDALPIWPASVSRRGASTAESASSEADRKRPAQRSARQRADRASPTNSAGPNRRRRDRSRSEEHTSELQSACNLVCRLLLAKKKIHNNSQ